MSNVPTAAKKPSTQPDQAISAFFHVETVTDLDDGQATLVAASYPNLGDLQVVTAEQVIAKADDTHRKISNLVRLALDHQAANHQHTHEKPRTWTVTNRATGQPVNGTCMPGCHSFHAEREIGTVSIEDLDCVQWDQANTASLPVDRGSAAEGINDWNVLSVLIKSYPVDSDPAKRVPVAAVEIIHDHYIEDLDPDGLAAVIDTFQERVYQMRLRHAELVRIRNEYFGRQA